MKLLNILTKILVKLKIIKSVYYINGAETLPPPLSMSEERELLSKYNQDS